MSLRNLPKIKAFDRPDGVQWDAPTDVLSKWALSPQAAEADDPRTISIYDQIGEDPWTGAGMTAKRVAGILRSIGSVDVTVNINSPGGDFFEGLAIYNLLREHPAKVSVRVMGYAASAASIIAMAGDEIEMGMGSFFMIHNAWGVAVGNQHDMRATAEVLAPFDQAMSEIYEARTGQKKSDVVAMMDAETWISSGDAVKKGFADSVTDRANIEASASAPSAVIAKRKLDSILASQGMPRSERRKMMRDISSGTQDATAPVTQDADISAGLSQLIQTMKK
ncbi:head maturation protease, ClpP-related [Paremcibacter congregatus]|uniref:head maturation protease, ClpP-related n=1 Tax=Paremcibacter congregatus TaxID=2043170 RepID=UPI0030EEC67C|tara:strand:- start:8616 stop:9452 length:837 start_codon:yes stop_codon:yes gene_type:complete